MGTYYGALNEQKGRQAWESGGVVPWRITVALDAKGLYGPEVDRACGVEEPAVDEWEAGTRYPTWEQLELLAELCRCRPAFFTTAIPVGDVTAMWMCTRGPGGGCEVVEPAARVLTYTAEAIAAANLPRKPPPPTPPRPPTKRHRLRSVA